MTLPDQSNLVRWGKATEKSCNICGETVGTAKHLLVGCRVLLNRGKYSRHHDKVLEIIREAVSLSVARAQRGIIEGGRTNPVLKTTKARYTCGAYCTLGNKHTLRSYI